VLIDYSFQLFFVSFWATVCETVRPMLADPCLSCLSVTLVYWGQTVGWIRMNLGMEVGLRSDYTVLYGDPAPPIFGPYLLWPNDWMD